jgi:hypothetical protein
MLHMHKGLRIRGDQGERSPLAGSGSIHPFGGGGDSKTIDGLSLQRIFFWVIKEMRHGDFLPFANIVTICLSCADYPFRNLLSPKQVIVCFIPSSLFLIGILLTYCN